MDEEVVIEMIGLAPERRYKVFRAIYEAHGGHMPAPSCNISGVDQLDRIHTVISHFENGSYVGTTDLTIKFTEGG